MDDLSGLEWTPASSQPAKPPAMSSANYYPTLRPTPPGSGRSTPSTLNNASNKPAISNKPSTPANDSFANLVSFLSSQPNKNFSLQARQKVLQKEKEKREFEQRQQYDARLGVGNASAWEQLGSGRATPGRVMSPPTYTSTSEYGGRRLSTAINKPFSAIGGSQIKSASLPREDTDDLLAAFDADTPVDSSTNFPVPTSFQYRATPSPFPHAGARTPPFPPPSLAKQKIEDLDDDPFGLGTMAAPRQPTRSVSSKRETDDDDVLGLLGKPVSELPPRPTTPSSSEEETEVKISNTNNPLDKALAELIDMGFPADKSRNALKSTESGLDVQAAVGLLLNQAHEESRQKSRGHSTQPLDASEESSRQARNRAPHRGESDVGGAMPAWMHQQSPSNSGPRRSDSSSPATGERDAAKIAAELGSNLFKTANSLWKTGTKKLNQAVQEFNSDTDQSQPKWMRESRSGSREPRGRTSIAPVAQEKPSTQVEKVSVSRPEPDLTDEALMLEYGNARPRPRPRQRPQPSKAAFTPTESLQSSRDQSPAFIDKPQRVPPKFIPQQPPSDVRAKLGRQDIEELSSQAYVSPARRKKPTQPKTEPDMGLFSDDFPTAPSPRPKTLPSQPKAISTPTTKPTTPSSAALPVRPPPVERKIPQISSIVLQSSNDHRLAGTSAFKLGNYAQANSSYTSSLSSLPTAHPLTIVLLTNRALTQLKTGNPKAAVVDAEAAMDIIGPARGQGETVDLGSGEGRKEMNLYWGKAMTRKAEALEQLERWSDAAKAWKECVEANVGGSASIHGRNRCEKAMVGGNSQAAPATKRPTPAAKPRVAIKRPTLSPAVNIQSAEAVQRLRAANAEADKVEEEKFALADSVDERLTNWRKGKEGNLRALLGSLDTVLWEGSGWKKVGMSELIVPGKVKVAYMKGISKVHPDKVSYSGK